MEKWTDIEKRHNAERHSYFTKLSRMGISKAAAAEMAGVSTSRMAYMLDVMGISWTFPEPVSKETATFERRRAMLKEGFSEEYIAREEGISVPSLRAYCNKYGIKRRIAA